MDIPLDRGCNPVAQTGCVQFERCTFFWSTLDPITGRDGCAPDGTVPRGEICEIDLMTGLDNCVAGTLCHPEVEGVRRCAEICDTALSDTCTSGSCLLVDEVFFDYEGVCVE